MEEIKVLVWSKGYDRYLMGILKRVAAKTNIICKDMVDIAAKDYSSYSSQSDFDEIIQKYYPDIILLQDVTSRNLAIDIPMDIKVIVYCDHYHEQFVLFGKQFYDMLPRNNYLLLPILDAQNVDRYGVMEDPAIRDKMYFTPFLPYMEEGDGVEEKVDCNKYKCDLSVTLAYKKADYYIWCCGIKTDTFAGRKLAQFIGELLYTVRREIRQRGTAYIDDSCINKMLLSVMEHVRIRQDIRDVDEFFRYWFNTIEHLIIPTEYGNCVVDWLVEKNYNVKLYGRGWKDSKKYERFAFGEIPDGTAELKYAYKYSKINVCSSCVGLGIHRRVFEAMENDCLCLQVETVQNRQFSDWRHYFEDGKDIVIYHDKKELYEKVDYFLGHDDERRKITNAARETLDNCPDIADVWGDVIVSVYKK